jgi:hypothetical protein
VLADLGVIGAYVARIYEQCQSRPIYVLKDASPSPAPFAELNDPDQSPAVPTPRHDSQAA